jgi:hypothetical protein
MKQLLICLFCFSFNIHSYASYEDSAIIKPKWYKGRISKTKSEYLSKNTFFMGLKINQLKSNHESLHDHMKEIHFLVNRGDTFALFSGFFDVWKLTNGEWKNLYKGSFKGFNYGNNVFFRNDTLFSLGGVGFWTNHMHLIYFSQNRGEWEYYMTQNRPLGLSTNHTMIVGDTIYALFCKTHEANSEPPKKRHFLFSFNSKKWLPFSLDYTNEYSTQIASNYFFSYQLQNKLYLISGGNRTVFNPALRKMFLYEDPSYNIPHAYFINDSSGHFVYHRTGKVTSTVSEIPPDKEGALVATFDLKNNIKPTENLYSWYLAIFVPAILIGLWFWFKKGRHFISRSKLDNTSADKPFESALIKIRESGKKTLSSSELDRIIEIDNESPEAARIKRSNWIKEVNLFYRIQRDKNLITRERDPKDRRFYVYKFHFD